MDNKFNSVHDLVSDSSMTQYCTNLYATVNGSHEINWLLDTDENGLKDRMEKLFATKTWPEDKLDAFASDVVDYLVSEFKPLEYFRPYLLNHIKSDLLDFQSALKSIPTIGLSDAEKSRVISSVKEYIKGKVPTALVLGGCTDPNADDNSDYPNIDKYIYQNQRKIDKVQAQDIMSPTNVLKETMFAVQSTNFIR